MMYLSVRWPFLQLEKKLFLSYSRKDKNIVSTIVKLLRIPSQTVFLDTDSINPGNKWMAEIDRAIARCEYFVLIWCSHSSTSTQVDREWKVAHSCGKKIVPVVLDETPLCNVLSQYEAIFASSLGHEQLKNVYFE